RAELHRLGRKRVGITQGIVEALLGHASRLFTRLIGRDGLSVRKARECEHSEDHEKAFHGCLRRRMSPKPARPVPTSASVAGSGVTVDGSERCVKIPNCTTRPSTTLTSRYSPAAPL